MKKIFIVAFILVFCQVTATSQSCLPEGITFSTQAEIDNFQTNYPGCTEIEGNVKIFGEGYNISDLDGLSVLTSIGGNLEIHGCWTLTSLSGLINVTSIGGHFQSIGNGLTSLSGLGNLTSMGGEFRIEYNSGLTSVTGLENVTSIGGDLIIANNDGLISLTGLDNIDAGSITGLYIYNNNSLSNCDVQSICDYLASPNGIVDILNNANGCNYPPEIANNCGVTLPCLPYGNYYFFTQSDIDNFQTNYPGCTGLEGLVKITGNDITNINGLSIVSIIKGNVDISDNPLLTNLTGLENVTSIGEYLYIEYNNALSSLTGLNNVTSIEAELLIGYNGALTSLTGLEGLTYIGGQLIVGGNENLTSLTGLEGLTSIGGYFVIEANTALTSLTGLEGLTYIGEDLIIGNFGGGGGNSALTSLTGLEGLTSIGGGLDINDNTALTSLSGLENLTSIGGYLDISYNNALTSLTGLDNIDDGSIRDLYILNNDTLSTCEVQSICNYLASPNGTIEIQGNANGCNSQEEVEDACALSIKDLNQGGTFSIFPNPSSNQFTIIFTLEQPAHVNLEVLNRLGQAVATILDESLSQGNHQVTWNAERLPAGVYFYRFSANGQRPTATGKMVVM